MVESLPEPDRRERSDGAPMAFPRRHRGPYNIGSSTFSSAVVRDSRLNPWKTNPISRFLTADNSRFESPETSRPLSR